MRIGWGCGLIEIRSRVFVASCAVGSAVVIVAEQRLGAEGVAVHGSGADEFFEERFLE